jgi:hypothetical protein
MAGTSPAMTNYNWQMSRLRKGTYPETGCVRVVEDFLPPPNRLVPRARLLQAGGDEAPRAVSAHDPLAG